MNITKSNAATDESGFGIVEIVVSMFLLALLAVAFLPLLIQGMRTSVSNSTLATASQLLDQQMSAVRGLPPYCDEVLAFDVTVPATTDARGTAFQPDREVSSCPADYPGVVRVRVAMKDGSDVLAEAVTMVYLEAATAPTPVPTP